MISKHCLRVLFLIFLSGVVLLGCGVVVIYQKQKNFKDYTKSYRIPEIEIKNSGKSPNQTPIIFTNYFRDIGRDIIYQQLCDINNRELPEVFGGGTIVSLGTTEAFDTTGLGTEPMLIENKGYHIYDYEALPFDDLYTEANINSTSCFIKIKRIYIKMQYQKVANFRTKESDSKNGAHNMQRIYSELIERIKDLRGDAATDMCFYIVDYNEISKKVTSDGSTVRTDYIFTADLVLSATIIKFKDGYHPDRKYLIKRAK